MSSEYESFKEQVRSTADIVETVSAYVPLKKRGQNYWGCCPFHGEKTPSFTVNPAKNMFYCFGCHEGGDIFKFIMKIENCGFIDAVKLLAGRYGIQVPERQKSEAELRREQKQSLIYGANELACRFYQACLLKTAYGKAALEYLQGRGITMEIIEGFSMGFALNSFNSLLYNLGQRNIAPQLLVESGLAAEGGRSGHYDKFRNRIMIPIKDPRGRIVGFGGRVLDDSTPKYLNTAETEWFNKRRLLFGMDVALKHIRKAKQAIVVEGYMDAISLHAAGINNVVASMGTAFAEEQAKLLRRMTEEVVFCYDSDAAGLRASVRAVSIARGAGLRVRIASVPEGKDPDEFVRHRGKEAFLQVIESACEGIDFQIDETVRQNNVNNLAGKVEAVSNVLPFLLECKSEIEAAEHIRRLAQKLTIDEGLITEEYRKAARQGNSRGAVQPRQNARPVDVQPVEGGSQAEELLLAVLLEQPELYSQCTEVVGRLGFTSEALSKIFACLEEQQYETVVDINRLNDQLDDTARRVLARLVSRELPGGDGQKVIEDCLRQMQREQLEKEYERHCARAEEYERLADERFIQELMESQRIKNEIKKLYGN